MGRSAAHLRVGLGILLAFWAPASVAAQEGCRYADPGNDVLDSRRSPGGGQVTNIRNPHFLCEDGVEIWADSAVAYSEQAMSQLIGRVRYRDRTRELRAREARYFSEVGRLQAQGDVRVTNFEDGSVIENGNLVYLRETDFRDEEEMTVTTGPDRVRPRALVYPARSDSLAPEADPGPPYAVEGDVIVLRGSAYFASTGDVRIERDSLFAFGDSAEYREADEVLVLVGSARVESGTYTLVGRTVTIGTATSDTSVIHARRDALLTGEDIVVNAPHIVLHLAGGAVERLVAVPLVAEMVAEGDTADLARPLALTENVELTADSLELTAPGEVVERILAAGSARSVSHARDSLNVESLPDVARSDWMEGDTIVISMRPAADTLLAPDSADAGYQVDRIVARVEARSLYRLAPEDSTAVPGADPPALHYVLGDEITLVMEDGQVRSMEVVGQTRGVHLEPLGGRARPDSVPNAAPDSVPAPGPVPGDDGGDAGNDFSYAPAATASARAFIERRIQRPAAGPRGRRAWNRR